MQQYWLAQHYNNNSSYNKCVRAVRRQFSSTQMQNWNLDIYKAVSVVVVNGRLVLTHSRWAQLHSDCVRFNADPGCRPNPHKPLRFFPLRSLLPGMARDFCYTATKIKFKYKYKIALVVTRFATQIYFEQSF